MSDPWAELARVQCKVSHLRVRLVVGIEDWAEATTDRDQVVPLWEGEEKM